MSQNIEENRKSWPKATDNFSVGNKEVNSQKVWEPPSDYEKGGQYGKVQTFTTRAGHSVEFDNTEGGERIRVIHKNGSYMDMQADGTWVQRSADSSYEIVSGDKNLRVKGATNVYIEGDCNAKIGGNLDAEIGGAGTISTGSKLTLNTPHLDVRGGKMTHNDVNVGDTHVHGGVEPGGSTTDVPV